MTNDGTNAYTWDRANRLLTVGGTAFTYAYNGVGQRIQQSVGATIINYLLDTQPGLFQTLTETTGVNMTRYVQGPMGLQQIQQPSGVWQQTVTDALGSVRGVVDGNNTLLDTRLYAPYGEVFGPTGTSQTEYGFTGEPTDSNGLVYLRARYYAPELGVFTGIDPIEYSNRYQYVSGNPIMLIDPAGLTGEIPKSCHNIYPEMSYKTCPMTKTEHPLISDSPSQNIWRDNLKFCRGEQKNDNINEIIQAIETTYGLSLPQKKREYRFSDDLFGLFPLQIPDIWTWDDLANVGRGTWIIENALSGLTGNNGRTVVQNSFRNTRVMTMTSGIYDAIGLTETSSTETAGYVIAKKVFELRPDTAGIVPPRAFGATGSTVYLRSGILDERIYIHELGHVLDFRVGSDFDSSTLKDDNNPSTFLYNNTNSKYQGGCKQYVGVEWGICIGTRGGLENIPIIQGNVIGKTAPVPSGASVSGFMPGIRVSAYAATDHFEYFAETWLNWILLRAQAYHDHSLLIPGVGTPLYRRLANTMDDNMPRWLRLAGEKM